MNFVTPDLTVIPSGGFMGFNVTNATLNNISVISWWSVLLVEENEIPGESHQPVTDKLYHIMYRVHLA